MQDFLGPDLFNEFKANSFTETLPAGTVVLEQSSLNKHLMVLNSGVVEVRLDGEIISRLDQPGEIFGEMSILYGGVSSASLVTKTSCEILKVDGEWLKSVLQSTENRARFFQQYALLLVNRLKATNQRAKQVELTFRELAAAKKQLELMNQSLSTEILDVKSEASAQRATVDLSWMQIEELTRSQSLAIKGLSQFFYEDLPALKLAPGADLDRLASVEHHLEPIISRLIESQAYHSKRVVFQLKSHKNVMLAKTALSGLGLKIEPSESTDHLSDLTFFQKGFEADAPVGLQDPDSKSSVRVRVEDHSRSELLDFIKSIGPATPQMSMPVGSRAFIMRSWQGFARYILGKGKNRLNNYLSPGTPIQSAEILSSEGRDLEVEKMLKHFTDFGVRKAQLSGVELIAEELLMNAIYDAPVDELGKSKYNHWDRKTAVHLLDNERPVFEYATDGTVMAIGVTDPFGALTSHDFLEHLLRCYEGDPESASREGKGGAGRGLHQIVENSSLLVVCVRPKKFTQFFSFVLLDASEIEEDLGPRLQISFVP